MDKSLRLPWLEPSAKAQRRGCERFPRPRNCRGRHVDFIDARAGEPLRYL